MAKIHLLAITLASLAIHCQATGKPKSYHNFKVVKIQTTDAQVLHDLESFDGLEFWNLHHVKGSIDVMVPPSLYPSLTSYLSYNNLTYSTKIKDVGSLITPQKVCSLQRL